LFYKTDTFAYFYKLEDDSIGKKETAILHKLLYNKKKPLDNLYFIIHFRNMEARLPYKIYI